MLYTYLYHLYYNLSIQQWVTLLRMKKFEKVVQRIKCKHNKIKALKCVFSIKISYHRTGRWRNSIPWFSVFVYRMVFCQTYQLIQWNHKNSNNIFKFFVKTWNRLSYIFGVLILTCPKIKRRQFLNTLLIWNF